jgi:hypothetical protein
MDAGEAAPLRSTTVGLPLPGVRLQLQARAETATLNGDYGELLLPLLLKGCILIGA